VKAFESTGAWLAVWPVELARLPQWLRARAASLELEIDDDAVRFIIDRTEGNLLAAHQELEKLKLGAAGKTHRSRGGAGVDRRQRAASMSSSSVKRRSAPTCRAPCASSPGCAAKAWNPRSRSGRLRAKSTMCGARRSKDPRAVGRSLPRRSKTPSVAPRNFPLRDWQHAPRAPIAMIKGQQRGDAWDEMALMVVEFAGRRALPITGTRAA
jgi:hypothetical protein